MLTPHYFACIAGRTTVEMARYLSAESPMRMPEVGPTSSGSQTFFGPAGGLQRLELYQQNFFFKSTADDEL
jgi:hypothetical protein